MQNQFFYTRVETIKGTEEVPDSTKEFRDSFNISSVIRSRTMEDGKVLVLLNDIHERSENVPDINIKTNKMVGYKRERNTFQSEIFLSPLDGERFYSLTSL